MQPAQPFFSIIVPSYNRPRRLAACLAALARIDYPGYRFEVVVVDDGSELPPADIVASFRDRLNIKLLTQPHSGPAAARTNGAAHATGEILVFTDDDCAPSHNWLRALSARFDQHPDCGVGGRTVNALPDNIYSTASQLIIDYLYAHYNADPDRAGFLATNNLALPADRFRSIGGLDTTFPLAAAEDREFCDRWIQYGFRLIYAPEVLVFHAHALKFRTFVRQQLNYGSGAFRYHRKRSRGGQKRFRLKSLSFYISLLSFPFSRPWSWQTPLLAMLFAVSQMAIAIGYFGERVRAIKPDKT